MDNMMLCNPTDDDLRPVADASDRQTLQRVEVSYEPMHHRYLLEQKSFTQQFSHVYSKRTALMKEVLGTVAKAKWGSSVHVVNKIIDTESE